MSRTPHLAVLALATLALAAAVQAAPRALLIGVADIPKNELPGVDLDINNMKKIAELMGFRTGEIKVMMNREATYANVTQALGTWVREGVSPEDHVLIYFSGHGTRVPDPEPGHAGGVDDALVLHDVQRVTLHGRATLKNVLIGHELGAALAAIPSQDVLVLVDACHSGTATRTWKLGNKSLGVASGYQKFFAYPGMPHGVVSRELHVRSGSENYAALSAARDDEFAVGTEQGGLFTLGVVQAIESAARERHQRSVAELRTETTAFIASHTDEQSRHHPVADGNEHLIDGGLTLLPLRGTPAQGGQAQAQGQTQGPTWRSLATLATQGEPLTLSGGRELKLGEEVTLGVKLPRGGFLNVVAVDSQDRATVLYPNKYQTTNEVKAGSFRFPTAEMNFVLRASEPVGPSLVVAFLTETPVNLLELGIEGRDAAGRMQQVFTEVTARATRALTVEARQKGFAAGTLTVRVEGAATH